MGPMHGPLGPLALRYSCMGPLHGTLGPLALKQLGLDPFLSAVRVCSRIYFFLCANLVWGLAKFKRSSSHRP